MYDLLQTIEIRFEDGEDTDRLKKLHFALHTFTYAFNSELVDALRYRAATRPGQRPVCVRGRQQP